LEMPNLFNNEKNLEKPGIFLKPELKIKPLTLKSLSTDDSLERITGGFTNKTFIK